MEELLGSPGFCGLLNDTDVPFGQCIRQDPEIAKGFYDVCVHDVCSADQFNLGAIKTAACESLAAFAEHCASLGYREPWRGTAGCRKLYQVYSRGNGSNWRGCIVGNNTIYLFIYLFIFSFFFIFSV